jgi:beta-glucosidase
MKTIKLPAMRSFAAIPVAALSVLLIGLARWPALAQNAAPSTTAPLFRNRHASVDARAADLLRRLTQDEKLSLLTGTGFTSQPIPRLGIPPMAMADAGQGVRGGSGTTLGPASLFPSGVAMASTWNPELVGRIGRAIGEEGRNKGTGVQVMLGPAINIHRTPLGGRNGEYFSEDPFLAARLAVGYVRGMQSTGVAACLKHYAANNQETDRFNVDVRVGERALREIYLPAFEAGVKEGGAWTVMASYNRINGAYATANHYLLKDVLKRGWGFNGLVMSDWGAVHETDVPAAGTDLEMPGPGLVTRERLQQALAAGQVQQVDIDDAVLRLLRTMVRVGLVDGLPAPDHTVVNSPDHQRLAREAAEQAVVLLKNQGGLLPLHRARLHSIAVIGQGAQGMQYGAAGSPGLDPFYHVSPLDGIRSHAGAGISVRYARGYSEGAPIPASALTTPAGAHGLHAEYFAGTNLQGQPLLSRDEPGIDLQTSGPPALGVPAINYSTRWTGRLTAPVTGHYRLIFTVDDGVRLFLDGKLLIDQWNDGASRPFSVGVDLVAGRSHDVRVEYYQHLGDAVAHLNWVRPNDRPYGDAIEAARASDVAVVCVTTNGTEGEGNDRPSMDLPDGQDDLIRAVAAANPRTVVVLNNGTPVDMRGWLARVPALIEAWFPGQEGGNALAAILFGDINPSGKLPDTLAAHREDYPDYGNYPETGGREHYAEGIYVGYRHFDRANIAPLFPFGYGLSYTTFRYADLRVSGSLRPGGTVTVRANVTNTGARAGAEVAELYLHDPHPRIDKPVRELKGFNKVTLQPGETKTVTFTLTPRDLAYFDVPGKGWRADAGVYEVQVGASSRDIRLRAPLRLTSAFTDPVPLSRQFP